jgi:hypothetical protein
LVQKVVTEYEVSETTTVPACACVMVGCPQPYPGAAGDMKHT